MQKQRRPHAKNKPEPDHTTITILPNFSPSAGLSPRKAPAPTHTRLRAAISQFRGGRGHSTNRTRNPGTPENHTDAHRKGRQSVTLESEATATTNLYYTKNLLPNIHATLAFLRGRSGARLTLPSTSRVPPPRGSTGAAGAGTGSLGRKRGNGAPQVDDAVPHNVEVVAPRQTPAPFNSRKLDKEGGTRVLRGEELDVPAVRDADGSAVRGTISRNIGSDRVSRRGRVRHFEGDKSPPSPFDVLFYGRDTTPACFQHLDPGSLRGAGALVARRWVIEGRTEGTYRPRGQIGGLTEDSQRLSLEGMIRIISGYPRRGNRAGGPRVTERPSEGVRSRSQRPRVSGGTPKLVGPSASRGTAKPPNTNLIRRYAITPDRDTAEPRIPRSEDH
jgi:hypothetical protein